MQETMERSESVPEPDRISPVYGSLKIAVPYFLLAGIWIAFSDSWVLLLFDNPEAITLVQTYKGLLFVVVTAFLLYLAFKTQIENYKDIVYRFSQNYIRLEKSNKKLIKAKEEIEKKVEELEKSKKIIYQQAFYDQLTGLPNRNMLLEDNSQHSPDNNEVLMLLDIDKFRIINDYYGFEIGDKFLIKLTDKLEEFFNGADAEIYRIVSDEFLVHHQGLNDLSEIEKLLEELQDFFSGFFEIEGHKIHFSYSIGIVRAGDSNYSTHKLLQKCETAMYQAKNNDYRNYEFHHPAMEEEIASYLKLDNDLRSALKLKEFELFYQPIFRASNGEIAKLEALIRWHKPGEGYIPPDKFIPFAEKTGLIFELDQRVFKEVCRHKKMWQRKGFKNFTISVNLSARQLDSSDFTKFVLNLIDKHEISSSNLELEITENAVMKNFDVSNKFLERMQKAGFPIALDDFGTGYSSLNYIMKLPISSIKIDRSFINNIEQDQQQYQIVYSIIELAKILGLEITVEGIETEKQKTLLQKQRVDYLQGFYLSPPVPADKGEQIFS